MIEFLLLFMSIILVLIIIPLASLYKIFKAIQHRSFRELKLWFYSTAKAIDIFGNVVASDLFNNLLIKYNGYKFGRRGETISSVIGKNYQNDTLTKSGNLLKQVLDCIDEDHCVKYIMSDEEINRRK